MTLADSRIRNHDFFKESSVDFYNKFHVNSRLIYGKHHPTPPLVTVLLTTYKRPKFLRTSLESALNQKGFSDYQIIVVDNEGERLDKETETSVMMNDYRDDRVIYYRHESSVDYRMDYAARLAQSKWIVFLHDDDFLSPDHLRLLTAIAEKYHKIKFLSSTYQYFHDSSKILIPTKDNGWNHYYIKKEPKSMLCLMYFTGWLGAMIDRKAYISIGGMPSIDTGIGDYCMVGKMMHRYGVYELVMDKKLYFYRFSDKQQSDGGSELWTNLYANQLLYHQYVASQYHPLSKDAWNRIALYKMLRICADLNHNKKHTYIDIEKMVNDSGMTEDVLLINDRFRDDIARRLKYEVIKNMFLPEYKYHGVIE